MNRNNIKVQITVFQNYGDELVKYGMPPMLEGFWSRITLRKEDDDSILLSFPVCNDDGHLLMFKSLDVARNESRQIVNKIR